MIRVFLAQSTATTLPTPSGLPGALKHGSDPAAHGDVDAVYRALFAAGVDGLFSDFPGLAVKARG